jgi:hypothetical protein
VRPREPALNEESSNSPFDIEIMGSTAWAICFLLAQGKSIKAKIQARALELLEGRANGFYRQQTPAPPPEGAPVP